MRFTLGCRIQFYSAVPVPVVLMLRPRSSLQQWIIQERYELDPFVNLIEYTDSYGNLCQRLTIPAGETRLMVEVEAETLLDNGVDQVAAQGAGFVAIECLPDSVLQFLLPSRYCESDKLYDLAADIVVNCEPGYAQVEAIRQWIHHSIHYEYGTSDSSTSALNVVANRQGVCRDFAHLGIALCRSLNIPARMVVGYLQGLKPMDQHAWFEAYLGDRWWTFDATQSTFSNERIVVAYGRDAADVALVTQFGPLQLTEMQVWIDRLEA